MLGRSTYGWLYDHPLDKDTTAYGVLDRILSGNANSISGWTLDTEQIGQCLIDALNPSSFEHLIVSLLQLEHPDEIWSHTGGPGAFVREQLTPWSGDATFSVCKLDFTVSPR